jgi:phenylpropionate dioxygenase-like ring-hydroxylating dioxygenase large terminal subunit
MLDGIPLEPPPEHSFMDPRGYRSQAFFDLEMSAVFPRSWIFVADVEDLKSPGDYVSEFIGYEPVVVLRGADGELRGFSNVCTHRASLLAEGTGNCGKTLVCPYHGWTFQLDGALTGIPYQRDMAGPVDRSTLGLHPIRVAQWERWVFVNVSGDAPPLLDYLEKIPSRTVLHRLSETILGHRLDDEVKAGWKVLMDNAYCDYHLPFVHAKSIGQFVDPHGLSEEAWTYTGCLTAPSNPYNRVYSVLPELEGEAREGSLGFSVFPNFFVVAFPNGGATVMWWTPMSIDRTRARVISYTKDPEDDPRAGRDLLQQIQDEDYEICEKVQKGLHSTMYRTGPRHDLELRVRAYQRRLIQMLAEEVSGTTPGMFDGPAVR